METSRLDAILPKEIQMARDASFKEEYYILLDLILASRSPYITLQYEIDYAIGRLQKLWNIEK